MQAILDELAHLLPPFVRVLFDHVLVRCKVRRVYILLAQSGGQNLFVGIDGTRINRRRLIVCLVPQLLW